MLKPFFVWLDGHPGSYWLIATGPTLLLAGWVGSRLVRESRDPPAPPVPADWRDFLFLTAFVLAWRWPFLLAAYEFNPDESQQIAGALTLVRDPVFWRSVDGTTSGPLNFYALLPLHWLGLPLDYFMARLTGLLFIAGALSLCLRTLAREFGRAAAWLGVLPAVVFFATISNSDLIHYSTEHLSLLLTAVAVALLGNRPAAARWRLRAGCAVAGALPFAKLQTAPLAAVLLAWAAWQVWREPGSTRQARLRQLGGAGLAAVTPLGLIALMVLATGQAETAVHRYLMLNVYYVSNGYTLAAAWHDLVRLMVVERRFLWFVGTAAAGLVAGGIFLFRRQGRITALLGLGMMLTLAAVVAVFAPRRGFPHYLLLVPVPLTIWLGAVLGGTWTALASSRGRRFFGSVAVLLGGALPLAIRALQPAPEMCGDFAYQWNHPRSAAAALVHALAGPRDSVAIWGWANNLYVEAALPQATRDAHTYWSIVANPQQAYQRATYLADLRRQQPAVFVDAVGPGAFVFDDRPTQGHEIFPELADYIRQHYTFVGDLAEARVYARTDVAARVRLSPAQLDQLAVRGRIVYHRARPLPPPVDSLADLPHKFADQRPVVMLLPPTKLEWELAPEVREVVLEFGFDPLAYLQGVTNGAEFVVELERAGNTRGLYRRALDPVRQRADRGVQVTRILLPPFNAGTRLVVRTTPGAHGDSSWDWVYLAGLEFGQRATYLPTQFPGFERVPDFADADHSALAPHDPDAAMLLHAPAMVGYVLKGTERELRFSYGMKAGAYLDGGNTDGAVFRVELQRRGQPAQTLFERFLQPVTQDADRGPQQATVALPAVRNGDRLLLSIDVGPAGNAAWDWTYISTLSIQ